MRPFQRRQSPDRFTVFDSDGNTRRASCPDRRSAMILAACVGGYVHDAKTGVWKTYKGEHSATVRGWDKGKPGRIQRKIARGAGQKASPELEPSSRVSFPSLSDLPAASMALLMGIGRESRT